MTDYREHIVKSFDDEISNVVHLVTQMATLVEEQYKLLYHVIDTGSPATTEDILENEPLLCLKRSLSSKRCLFFHFEKVPLFVFHQQLEPLPKAPPPRVNLNYFFEPFTLELPNSLAYR